jgi:putative transposase
MKKSPRVHTPAFKAQVALAALKGDKTLSEIAAHYQVHVKLVQAWKKLMLEQAASVFEGVTKPTATKEATAQQAELFEQIGRLKMELEWIKKKAAAFLGVEAVSGRTRSPGTECSSSVRVAGTEPVELLHRAGIRQ